MLLGESKWQKPDCLVSVYQFLVYFVMKMSFWAFVVCKVDADESLEGIFPGGLINCGKNFPKTFD